ncbi:tRNA-dihydrouridine synthase, partial [candidate division GN15 bacterium]|nr:tRNA-dihydrouridine synthase [candidate division GN15 bacterium]
MSRPVSKKGFWADLPRPFFILAPMADVTDAAFRIHITKCGKPDVLYTEFVSVDGLCSKGRDNLLRLLRYSEIERPIVAQFFGNKPNNFHTCAELANELGFDGIDINMGCPDKSVCKGGSGAGLIRNPELAKEIVDATIEGAGELPVAVKTRIGYNQIELEEWAGHLLETNPVALIFHMRTKKEMSKVPAHLDLLHVPVEMAKDKDILICANGDIDSLDHGYKIAEETGIDGIMMGRAVFGNPWVFNRERRGVVATLEEKFAAMLQHARIFEEVFPDGQKPFYVMRKHLMAYANGFPGAKELRK